MSSEGSPPLIEMRQAHSQPGEIWYDYRPEKPRLFLGLDQSSNEKLEPIFSTFEPHLGRSIARLYDHVPGVPLATFSHPRELYPAVQANDEKMDKFYDASNEFHQSLGLKSFQLHRPSIKTIKFDGHSVIALTFEDESADLFPLREELIRAANKKLRLFGQVYTPGADWLDKVHKPFTALPIARPRTKVANSALHASLIAHARNQLPDTLCVQPTLCIPTTIEEPESSFAWLNNPEYEHRDLAERAIAAAEKRPNKAIHYSGPLSPAQRRKAKLLGNLTIQLSDTQRMMSIR